MSATAFAASDDMLVACTEGRRFAGRPIAQWTKSPGQDLEIQFIVTDHLGTPVGLLDSTEAVVWRGFLDPFGSEDRHGPSSFGLSLRLPGQLDDPFWHRVSEEQNGFAADLYYNVHRWYEPGTGRYVSADPLLRNGSAFSEAIPWPYQYAAANPIAYLDPLGLQEGGGGCCDCPGQLWGYGGVSASWGGLFWGHTTFTGTYTCKSNGLEVEVEGDCSLRGILLMLGVQWDTSIGSGLPLIPGSKACMKSELLSESSGITFGKPGIDRAKPGKFSLGVGFSFSVSSNSNSTGSLGFGVGGGGGFYGQRCSTRPYKPLIDLSGPSPFFF